MEVNTKNLENTKGEYGMYMLDCCPDTILNHKARLIEAGVLINNQFRGSERGTLHHINPQILVVFDDLDEKLKYTENQLLKIFKPELFRETVLPTCSINKPIVKRNVRNLTSPIITEASREVAPDTLVSAKEPSESLEATEPLAESFTRSPIGKYEKEKLGSAENFNKKEVPPTKASENSDYLSEILITPNILAQELARKEHEKAKPLPLNRLNYEATNGTMPKDEFRELLLQDIFKQVSKIYKKHPHFDYLFAGVWYSSLKGWLLSKILKNSNGHLLNKTKCLYQYRCLLFAINNTALGAVGVARRTNFVAPHPKVYLNPELKTPGSFGYHFANLKKNSLAKMNAEAKIKINTSTVVAESKEYTNNLIKINRKLAQYYNGKIDFSILLSYVRNNMPKEIQVDFHKHLANFKNNKHNITL